MNVVRDGKIVQQSAPLLGALNLDLRDEYVADCENGVRRWNQALEDAGLDERLTLPHEGFFRKVGTYAGHHVSLTGEVLDEATWEAERGDWLPTPADREQVAALVQPQYEEGKFADWIAPPPQGINDMPIEYDDVRFSVACGTAGRAGASPAAGEPDACAAAGHAPAAAISWICRRHRTRRRVACGVLIEKISGQWSVARCCSRGLRWAAAAVPLADHRPSQARRGGLAQRVPVSLGQLVPLPVPPVYLRDRLAGCAGARRERARRRRAGAAGGRGPPRARRQRAAGVRRARSGAARRRRRGPPHHDEEGLSGLLVEQDLHAAFALCGRILVMQKARTVHGSSTEEFRSAAERGRRLLGVG